MMYNGSSWTPIISLGNMTLYVDGASGTDSQDKGYGTVANAFATIQYAVNQIPLQYSGDVYISIASGTYSGFTVQGKYPTGNYYIYINGTLQTDYTGTITSGTVGSAENYCTITVSGAGWTTNQWVGYLANWNSQDSVIMSNTTDTLTVVGKSSVTPSGTLYIKSQATTLSSGVTIYSDYIYLQNLYANDVILNFTNARNGNLKWCKVRCHTSARIYVEKFSLISIYFTYIYADANMFSTTVVDMSNISTIHNSYWNAPSGDTGYGLQIKLGAKMDSYGETFAINGFGYGIFAENNSNLVFSNYYSMKDRITNCTYGIYLKTGSQSQQTSNIYYSGCTTNYYADAASYAYYG